MINAVIFDMDGVLIDSESVYKSIEQDLYKELGIVVPQDLILKSMGMVVVEWWKKIIRIFDLDEDPEKWGEIESQRYLDYLMDEHQQKIPMEGALELMASLKKKNIKMAVASSSGVAAINRVCELFGYDDYIDEKISGTNVKHGKPAPDIFLKAGELLNVTPKHCLVIEDSYNGIQAALAAGINCVAYLSAPEGTVDTSKANYRIKHHREVIEIVDQFK